MEQSPSRPRWPKALLLRLLSVMVGSGLSLLLLGAVVCGYLVYCRSTGTDARFVTPYAILRNLCVDRDYLNLLRLVTTEPTDTFDTVWDTTDAVRLSRQEFLPTEMYGRAKYRYKPFLRYVDAEVWSGFDRERLSALDTPEIRAAVERCRVFRKVFIETEEHGFKRTAFSIEPGKPVVLFVGDSFTEGLDVASPDTFVSLFGDRMRKEGLPGIPVNAGVNGYGTLEECWTVEHFAAALNARVVIENLFPNDVESDFPNVVLGGPVPEENYAEMFRYLDRMTDHCRSHGILLVVSAIPAREQMSPRLSESPFETRVRAWSQSRNVVFLDPLQRFRDAGAENVYFPVDPHLSEKGHATYADFLFEACRTLLERALAS